MALRPYYVEALIDGRSSSLEGGPRSKDGQMSVYLLMRDKGRKKTAYIVRCLPKDGNKLCIEIEDSNGDVVHRTETEY